MEKSKQRSWWLQSFWLLSFFLMYSVSTFADDLTNAWDYFQVDNTAYSPERPYIDLQYADYDYSGDDDAVRKVSIYVRINGADNKGVDYELAYMDRCYDKMQRKNLAYGMVRVESTSGSEPRIVHLRYYPSKDAINAGIQGFRETAWWDIDDDWGNGYNVDVYRTYSGYKNYTQLPVGTFSRNAPGKITFSTSNMPTYSGTDGFYNKYAIGASNYYTNADYGYISTQGSSASLQLNSTFSNKDAVSLNYFGGTGRNLTLNTNSAGAPSNDYSTIYTEFDGTIRPATIPGCSYPSGLIATPDMWTKKVSLSWTANTDGRNTDGKWYIYRYEKSKGVSTRKQVGTVALSTTTFTDPNQLDAYETDYVYEVSFGQTSWNISAPVSDLTAMATTRVTREFNMNLSLQLNTDNIVASWTHPAIPGSGSYVFKVLCSEDDGANWKEVGQVNRASTTATSHSYTHSGLSNGCTSYKYKVQINLLDKDFYSDEKSGSITGSSHVDGLTASKGTYPSMVKLSWTAVQIGTTPTKYVLYRRILGTEGTWSKVYNVSGTTDNYYFEDNSASPGQYYEYKVQSTYMCSGKETQPVEAFNNGFSQATGSISGRIKYGSGTSVSGVRVSLTKNGEDGGMASQFRSLHVNGLGGGVKTNLTLDDAKQLYGNNQPFSIQMWANVDVSNSAASPTLIDAKNAFSLLAKPATNGQYQLVLHLAKENVDKSTNIMVAPGQFHNITLAYDGNKNWTVYRMNSSAKVDSSSVVGTTAIAVDTQEPNLSFGSDLANTASNAFKGYVDEIRIWGKVIDSTYIKKNFDHLLVGSETGLRLYWPFDEGIVKQSVAYDYSQTAGIANGLHGSIQTNNTISDVTPATGGQFALYGMTDEQGNYVIRGIPFSGAGTNYTVTPMMGIHKFDPLQKTCIISSNPLNRDGIDFDDKSSFDVSGTIYYKGTKYPVQGAALYVDGLLASKDGEAITTNENGEYKISVSIGDHFITVKKNGHVFENAGRYPADPDTIRTVKTFDRVVTGLTFYDKTLVNVAGRVCGGAIEEAKPLGLGQSVNNIGVASLKLSAGIYSLNDNGAKTVAVESSDSKAINSTSYRQSGDAEATRYIIIETDPKTGEFSAMLPPLNYKVDEIKIKNNPDIKFSGSYRIDASNPLIEWKDSVKNGTDYDRYAYNTKFVQVYHSPASFTVTDADNKDGAFGIASYQYEDLTSKANIEIYKKNTDGSITYNYGAPIFKQQEYYNFKLKGFEQYTNADTKVLSTVPLAGNIVTIGNALSSSQKVYVEDGTDGTQKVVAGQVQNLEENQLQLDSVGEATYTWQAGLPNIATSTVTAVPSYSRTLSISCTINGLGINWSGFDGNGKTAGIILGELPTGNNFVTSGPDKVEMILRDPAGSNSSAWWESGTSSTMTNTAGVAAVTDGEITTVTHLGFEQGYIAGTPGVGTITESKTAADITVGLNTTTNSTGTGSWTTTTTTTKKISTSAETEYVGAMGDVFIGNATNIIFGNVRQVGFTPDANGVYSLGVKDKISTGLRFGTSFNYTQYYIENVLLPNLEKMRNNKLQWKASQAEIDGVVNNSKVPMYFTTLQSDDANYGTNNTDKVWGANANKTISLLKGPSYTMVLPKTPDPKTVYQDSILWINNQIANWKATLAKNEEAKVIAIDNREAWLDKNYSFDAGTSIEASTTTETSKSLETTWQVQTMAILGAKTDVEIAGTGVDVEVTAKVGGDIHGSNTIDLSFG